MSDTRCSTDCSGVGDESTALATWDDIDAAILHCGHQELPEADESIIHHEVLCLLKTSLLSLLKTSLLKTMGSLLAAKSGNPHPDWGRLEYFSNRTNKLDYATIEDLARLNGQLWQVFATAKRKRTTLPFIRKQLDDLATALRCSHGENAHKRLCALTGDLLQLAGEIFFDSSQYTHAAHCYTLAAAASKEASQFDLWACAITRHAFIGIYKRQFDKSLHMLDSAIDVANRGDSSLSTRQWVQAVRAESLAGLGKLDECRRALDEAEQVNKLTGRVHTSGWLRFDGSRLAEERGTCYVELGRPELAEVALMQALNQNFSARRRGSVLIDLAMIGVQRRDPEYLVMYAGAALDTARQTGSGVIGHKLQDLQTRLVPFLNDRHVRHLNEQITAQIKTSVS